MLNLAKKKELLHIPSESEKVTNLVIDADPVLSSKLPEHTKHNITNGIHGTGILIQLNSNESHDTPCIICCITIRQFVDMSKMVGK